MLFLRLSLLSTVVAASHYNFDFTLDYFLCRNIKIICLLVCGTGGAEVIEYTKVANCHHMLVTVADINRHNISRVEKCLQQTTVSIGVVLNAECQGAEETLLFASQNMMFTANHMWLITEKKNDTYKDEISEYNVIRSTIVGYFQNLNISVDADIIVASKLDSNEYILHEVYNFGAIQGGDLIVIPAGSWSPKSGITLDMEGYKYYKRWDFQQLKMRMIFVMSPMPKNVNPRMLTDRRPTLGLNTATRTSAMILHELADIHNFSFNYTIADRWIGTYETNSTRVVANSLYFREQDISPILRFQAYLLDKLHVVYPPLTSIETRYYYRIPTEGPGKFENQFLRPLSKGAWLCVMAVSSLCVLLLLMTAYFERRTSSIQYAFFSVVASVCQQFFEDVDDVSSTRPSTASKLTVLVTGLSCVLIYNYYTSSVVSWLLNGPPPSITSLQELLESPLELLFEDVGYTRSWLQKPNYYYNRRNAKIEDELRSKKVNKTGHALPPLMSVEQGIAMVKAGGYAYHTETDRANEIISRTFTQPELCEMGSLQSMEQTRLYPAVQHRSPYMEFFVWSQLRLTERGVVSCIQQHTNSPSVECEGSSPRALALGGAAPAFILLASGFGLGTIIMFVERCIYRRGIYLKNRSWNN